MDLIVRASSLFSPFIYKVEFGKISSIKKNPTFELIIQL